MPLRLVLAHWRRHRVRTSLTVLSVAVAIFLFCFLQAVLTTLESTVTSVTGNRLISSHAVSLFAHLRISQLPKIERVPGVRRVGHWTWFGGVYVDPKNFFPRFGTDVESFRDIYGDRSPDGAVYVMPEADWEAFAREKRACIVGKGLVDRFGFSRGDTITLQGDIFPVDLDLTVRGVYETGNPTYDDLTLFFHWSYLDEATGRTGRVSTFIVDLEEGADPGAVSRAIDDMFRSSTTPTLTQSELAFQSQFLTMWGNVPLLFTAIGTAVLLASFLITLNAMLLGARERVVEVGVLKTLGFRDGRIAGLYVLEGLALALLGGLVGIGAARLLADGDPLVLETIYLPVFVLRGETAAMALGIAAALGTLAGLAPAVMASRTPITAALRRLA